MGGSSDHTPYYTTSVWVGYDMPKTLKDSREPISWSYLYDMEKIHEPEWIGFETYDWRSYPKESSEE